MNVLIRVFTNAMLVQIGNGPVLRFYDWPTILSVIRNEDHILIQDYIGLLQGME